MSTLVKVLKWMLAMIVLFYVAGFLVPNNVHVERSLTMNASPEAVSSLITDFKNWSKWSPWDSLDPNMKKEFLNGGAGIGSGYTWVSQNKNVGKGKMSMIDITPGLIKNKLEFDGMGASYPSFAIVREGESTKVTWMMNSNGEGVPLMMKPMSNWFSLFMDKMVGPDFEQGLKNMKEVAETVPKVEQNAPSTTIK